MILEGKAMAKLIPIACVMLLLAVGLVQAEESAPDLSQLDRETLETLATQLHQRVAQLEERVDRLERENRELRRQAREPAQAGEPATPNATPSDAFAEARQTRQAEIIRELRRLQAGEGNEPKIRRLQSEAQRIRRGTWAPQIQMEVGSVGSFVNVDNRTPEQRMRMLRTGSVVVDDPHSRSVRIVQVIDDSNALIRAYDRDIWLADIDASNWADGTLQELPGVFRITGTRQFETAAGSSRTVLEAKPQR